MSDIIFQAVIGLSSGFAVSSGIFAFIMSLGIIERMADVTKTVPRIKIYETIVFLGAVFGNLLTVYKINIPFGEVFSSAFGLFSGIFTGMVAIALIEILESIPIMFRRSGIKKGLGIVILSIAVGKLFGSFIQFFKGWTP